MQDRISRDVQNVHNFESLVDFLRESLNWPIPDEGLEFDDIIYDWSAADLELDPDTQARVIGCRQLRLFDLSNWIHEVVQMFNPYRYSANANPESLTFRRICDILWNVRCVR